MKTKSKIAILLVAIVAALTLAGCRQPAENTGKPNIVTSTALISQITERVAGDAVTVVNIIPPAQCPGHFDVTPGDIQKLANADLFFYHNWQGEQFSEELIASAANPGLKAVKLGIEGNWLVPAVQKEATDAITAELVQLDTTHGAAWQQAADNYKNIVTDKEAEVRARLAGSGLSQVKILCADQQAGFVGWLGLDVAGIFPRPESLTPQMIKDSIDQGRSAGVTLVIDNLQSGADAGKGIAEELGCKRIIISNFPGGLPDTETWEKAVDKNIDMILEAVAN